MGPRPDKSQVPKESISTFSRELRGASSRAVQADFARLGAVCRHDDSFTFHLLDHPRRAIVADSKPPLDHRDRRLVGLHHDSHRLIIHLVLYLAAESIAAVLAGRLGIKNFHAVLRRALLAQEIGELANLVLADKRSMQAAKFCAAWRHEEHITGAEQP